MNEPMIWKWITIAWYDLLYVWFGPVLSILFAERFHQELMVLVQVLHEGIISIGKTILKHVTWWDLCRDSGVGWGEWGWGGVNGGGAREQYRSCIPNARNTLLKGICFEIETCNMLRHRIFVYQIPKRVNFWRTKMIKTRSQKKWKSVRIILQQKGKHVQFWRAHFWYPILKHEDAMAPWRRDEFSIFVDR